MAYPKRSDKAKRPLAGVPFNKKQIIELIGKYRGNLSRIADAIGSSRQSVRRFIDNNIDVRECLDQARERWIDDIEESVLARAHESNDTALQCFVLKTQGKARGWEQDENRNAARDVASAAFDFIVGTQKPNA
jgi:hypothetical protein